MTDLGPVQQFLGIQIERNRQKRTLRIHQKPYIESILKRFQMENCNGVSTPMEINSQLIDSYDFDAPNTERLDYQRAIGSIMYAMLGTQPNLGYTISTLSKFYINPGLQHAQAVQRVFRYLKRILDYGITFRGIENLGIQEAIQQEKLKGLLEVITFRFTDSD